MKKLIFIIIYLVGNQLLGQNTYPTNTANWNYWSDNATAFLSPSPNVFEDITDGIKFFGSAYRKGGQIINITAFDTANIDTIYVKWKIWSNVSNSSYRYMHSYLALGRIISFSALNFATTDHSYNGSILVQHGVWNFTRVILNTTTKKFTSILSSGNYDSNGGVILKTDTGSYLSIANLVFAIDDNYAGASAWGELGELRFNSHSTVMIENYNDNMNVSVYPDPVASTLIIVAPQKSEIEILNIEGQLIQAINANEGKTFINVSAFARGMYFIEMKTEKGLVVKKFMKE
jgi:hypothetical protein